MPYFLRGLRGAMYTAGWTPGSEMSRGFPDLWSAVQFAACRPPSGELGEESTTAREAFGDAAVWCGCALLRLLGHPARVSKFAARWEQDDFSSHVLRARELEMVASYAPQQNSTKQTAAFTGTPKKPTAGDGAGGGSGGASTRPQPSVAEAEALEGWVAAAEEWREEARDAFFALDRWLRGRGWALEA